MGWASLLIDRTHQKSKGFVRSIAVPSYSVPKAPSRPKLSVKAVDETFNVKMNSAFAAGARRGDPRLEFKPIYVDSTAGIGTLDDVFNRFEKLPRVRARLGVARDDSDSDSDMEEPPPPLPPPRVPVPQQHAQQPPPQPPPQRVPPAVHVPVPQQVHVRPAAIAPPPISLDELNRAHARAAAAEAAAAAAGATHAQFAYNNQRIAAELQRVAGRAHESELEVERTRTLFSEENRRILDELASARAKVLELQSAHHQSAAGRASAEQQAAAAREHIKYLAAELGELRQKESQLEKLSAALEKSNESAAAAHAKAEERQKGWQLSAANEAQAVKRAQELEIQIGKLQADNGSLVFRSSATADASTEALRELATRNGALEASRIQLEDEKHRISEELIQMRETVQDLESKRHSTAKARVAAEAQTKEAHKQIAALTNEMRELRQKETQLAVLEKDNGILRADKGALAFRSSASSDAHRILSIENQQLREQLAAYQAARAIHPPPVRPPAELAPLVVGRGRPRSAGVQQAALDRDGVDAFAVLLGPGEGAREQALARKILIQHQKALAVKGGVAKRPASAGALKRAPLVLPPPKFGAFNLERPFPCRAKSSRTPRPWMTSTIFRRIGSSSRLTSSRTIRRVSQRSPG